MPSAGKENRGCAWAVMLVDAVSAFVVDITRARSKGRHRYN